jgi:BASS family bile acid:Na+ symporter
MLHFLQLVSRWLANYTSVFIIAIAVFAFFVPQTFSWVVGNTQTTILGLIMLSMGLTLTTDDFRILAKRPLDIFIGACAQYILMPGIAWTLTKVFHLDTALAIGILLVGTCPGGVSSNIMSYLCHGDVAFSVGMTCASTLLAPVMTPMLMLWLAGQSVDVDGVGMFLNILIVTIIPVALGCLLNYYFSKRESFATMQSLMPGFGVVCLALIVGGVICAVHDKLIERGMILFLWTFFVVFLHNSLGYLTGYLAGVLVHFNRAKKRTISIEVGMQNAGLATNLASNFFLASYPLSVIPCAVSCAWHSISGTILAGIFLMWDKHKGIKYSSN